MTELAPVQKVAVLALVYRELAQRYDGKDLSVLGKMGADALQDEPIEWDLHEAMRHPYRLLPLIAELAEVDPLRAEAMLHAFPPVGALPGDEWASEFLGRWGKVRETMNWLEREGLTTSVSELDEIAYAAYALATGRRVSDVRAEWSVAATNAHG
jgi:hypothetical protein